MRAPLPGPPAGSGRVRSGGRRGFIGRQLDLDGDELADYAVRFGEDQSDLAKACATLAEFNAWHAAPSPDGRSMVADTIHPDVGPQLFPVKAGRPAFTVCASGPSSIEADPCCIEDGVVDSRSAPKSRER